MLTQHQVDDILASALERSSADQTEVLFTERDFALTRFAGNSIHQNVAESVAFLMVRAVVGRQVGVASTTSVTAEGIGEVVNHAAAIARALPENPYFTSLPGPASYHPVDALSEGTLYSSPRNRAEAVRDICQRAEVQGIQSSGALSASIYRVDLANSLGIRASYSRTLGDLMVVAQSPFGSGYADRLHPDVEKLGAQAAADEAFEAAAREEPVAVEPGEYEVILKPYAVSDILDFLAFEGFNALAVQEGRSFMSGKLGQRLLGENIAISDDPLDPAGVPVPFDFEGVPKKPLDLILRGVARTACYDTYSAAKEGKASTGHAMSALASDFGSIPTNLFLKPGTASREDLLASVHHGLLVTRFWYTRTVHPLSITVTGTTRDGTYLIENGAVVAPVRNLRFTQSYVEALNRVELIGNDARLVRTSFPLNHVPSLKISRWNFTGVTEY